MSVYYDINPDLDLLIYFIPEKLTGTSFFDAAQNAENDPRYRDGMKIIIDIFHAEVETTVHDLYLAVEKNKELNKKGRQLGQTAVLTLSTGLKFLGDALKIFSPEAPTNFGIFNTRIEAIRWLGLSDAETETHNFWDATQRQTKKLLE